MRKFASITLLALLLIGMFTFASNVRSVGTITVPDDYPTIQQAIIAAASGDTIFVRSGTYFEHVVVNRTVSLIGENKTTTIIDGNGSGAVLVSGRNVGIRGFTIRNSYSGIELTRGNSVHLSLSASINDNIIKNSYYGIYIYTNSKNNSIAYNVVSNCDIGILVKGIDNVVEGNTISNCSDTGVRLDLYSSNDKVINNIVTANLGRGIEIDSTIGGNYLADNLVSRNRWGIQFRSGTGTNNIMRNNSLSDNVWNLDFFIIPSVLSGFVQDIDSSNTIDGKPIYYLVNRHNVTIPENAGFVAMVNSTDIVMKNLNITNWVQGVICVYSNRILMQNVSANMYEIRVCSQIVVENSSGSMRFRNTTGSMIANSHGISVQAELSDDCRIFNNLNSSIYLSGSSNNTIENNSGGTLSLSAYIVSPAKPALPSKNNMVTYNTVTGIEIRASHNNTICNNTIVSFSGNVWNYTAGILFAGACNNTVKYNSIAGAARGIAFEISQQMNRNNILIGNRITNNTIGIMLTATMNNVLKENAIAGSRYYFGGDVVDNDIDASNTVNGKSVYIFADQNDLVIDPSTHPNIGYLALADCKNVVIRNLTLTNNIEGLLLFNTQNVTAINCTLKENIVGSVITGFFNKILNSTISNNLHGITLEQSGGNNTVSGNTIQNNTYRNIAPADPRFEAGYGPPAYLQTVVYSWTYGGCYIESYNNTITSNVITNNEKGVVLYSGGNTFRGNILTGNRFNIDFQGAWTRGYLRQFNQDMDPSNLIEGRPIYYWINQHDKQVPEPAGFVVLVNCTKITIKNLNITHNKMGIVLAGTNSTEITNVTITDCLYGIFIRNILSELPSIDPLISSVYNTIANCTLTNNGVGVAVFGVNQTSITKSMISKNMIGIWLLSGSDNQIKSNIITNNTVPKLGISPWPFPAGEGPPSILLWRDWGGIVLEASSNIIVGNTMAYNDVGLSAGYALTGGSGNWIYHNNFINNTDQLWVGSKNFWNVGYPRGGNFYSDYMGTDNYGGSNQNEPGPDGIGDTPHDLPLRPGLHFSMTPEEIKALEAQDKYPLMHPWSSLPVHNMNTGAGYATIQEAINANETVNGHTIFVEEGIYNEHVDISKSLSLFGENRLSTIIDGSQTGTVMSIRANDVEISGFTIQNGGKEPWTNYGACIQITGNSSILRENTLRNSTYGIEIEGCNVTIMCNRIEDNFKGIDILFSLGNNTISGNTVTNSIWYGIEIIYSSNNTIFKNRFINNNQSTYTTGSINKWDNGIEGNYWSDYTGVDSDHNGIGDSPYVIDANNQDDYPLISPYVRGDYNHDGKVNMTDVDMIRQTWQCKQGEANYNPNADFNMDGIISIKDLAIIGVNWQEHV